MTNDDNSEGLFSILQAKITVLESETKKTREPDNTINQSIRRETQNENDCFNEIRETWVAYARRS